MAWIHYQNQRFFLHFLSFIFPSSSGPYLFLPVLSRSAIFYENGIKRMNFEAEKVN